MKIILIILLVIIGIIQISFAHDSSETKMLKNSNINNTTELITEKYSKEISSHKHKKFIVTRKPPINYHHNKNTRIKKKDKHKDTISKHTTKSRKLTKHVRPKVYKRKHYFQTKTNENIKKIFQDKIVKIDDSNEDESEKISAIICKGIDIKNLVKNNNTVSKGVRLINGHNANNYKPNDISKLRKCLSKLKKNKSSVPSGHKKGKVIDNKVFNAVQKLLEKIDKSVGSEKEKENRSKTNSSEEKDRGSRVSLNNEKLINSNAHMDKENNNNLRAVTRPKRSVNIIEEERAATTSSGFTFTGRDLSINHQFTYRNIHY